MTDSMRLLDWRGVPRRDGLKEWSSWPSIVVVRLAGQRRRASPWKSVGGRREYQWLACGLDSDVWGRPLSLAHGHDSGRSSHEQREARGHAFAQVAKAVWCGRWVVSGEPEVGIWPEGGRGVQLQARRPGCGRISGGGTGGVRQQKQCFARVVGGVLSVDFPALARTKRRCVQALDTGFLPDNLDAATNDS